MNTDIILSSLASTPDEYNSPDGQLDTSFNLLLDRGAIRPVIAPHPIDIGLTPDDKIILIHNTPDFTHFIVQRGSSLYWMNRGDRFSDHLDFRIGSAPLKITDCKAVGNTIVAIAQNGVNYWLWKNGTYKPLGTGLPEIDLAFGLDCYRVSSDDFSFPEPSGFPDNDDAVQSATNHILAQVNKFIADEATAKGRFIHPFLVRYAYRLYDGTLSHHSAPVLMLPNTGPGVYCASTNGATYIHALAHRLCVQSISSDSELHKIVTDYADIITSVDIFVSAPIPVYDQNGKVNSREALNATFPQSHYTVCRLRNGTYSSTTYDDHLYSKRLVKDIHNWHTNPGLGGLSYPIPVKSDAEVQRQIADCSAFHLLHSYRLPHIPVSDTMREVPVPDDYLQSLQQRELMTDDFDSHDQLRPKSAFVYNNRLSIIGISKRLFDGFPTAASATYTGRNTYYSNQPTAYPDETDTVTQFVRISRPGGEIFLQSHPSYIAKDFNPTYLYYPNTDASEIILRRVHNGSVSYQSFPLTPHNYLNGAVFHNGFNPTIHNGSNADPVASPDDDCVVPLHNRIYTSAPNNPFHFPLLGITSVGAGNVYAIAATTQALSQGQFGQFPLYAFTDQGVWALQINVNGSFSSVQPVSRDNIIPGSVPLQTDNAVIFASDRGLMRLSGSSTQCVSEAIDNLPSSLPTTIPQLPDFPSLPALGIREFIAQARMAYDYTNQRVLIFRPDLDYAYVYSAQSSAWAIASFSVKAVLNSYPEALAVDNSGRILKFSDNSTLSSPRDGLIVTRPIKLGDPDTLKTIHAAVVRGRFPIGAVQTVLFASRDLINWRLVWSSKTNRLNALAGSPYKYFRFAIYARLDYGQHINAISVDFTPRAVNRFR